jgi:uncharacterized protein YoxC
MMASVAKPIVNLDVVETRTLSTAAQREALSQAADAAKKKLGRVMTDPATPPGEKKKTRASGSGEPETVLETPEQGELSETMAMVTAAAEANAREEAMEIRIQMRMAKMLSTMFEKQREDIRNDVDKKLDEKLDAVQAGVKGVEKSVEDLKSDLQEERDERLTRQGQIRDEMMSLTKRMDEIAMGPEVKSWKEVAEDGEGEWQTKGKGKGKSKGKEEEKREEMARTVVYNGYGEGVPAAAVVKHIQDDFVHDVDDDDISEVYAYGKNYASGGAVRFKTERSMWKHLVSNKGANWKMYKERKVYARAGRREGVDVDKSKAVRKAMRSIYETEKGTVEELKKEAEANYARGEIFFKGYLVAKWNDSSYGSKGELEWTQLPEAAARHKELMAAAA